MNAIISLCHFCEFHGPRILFCTQPIHQQESAQESDGNLSDSGSALRERRVLSPTAGLSGSSDGLSASLPPMKNDSCEACHSVQSGFMSHDDEAKVSYVSNQHPHHPQVFSMVRQACVRSLSCEVCPGREGPIFFGDEQRGHVLSYTFYIRDSHARGFQRWYSILVVMMDKIYLLNSWPFLVPNLRVVINILQAKAKRVHDEEQLRCPQRALRLTPSTTVTPGNFRQKRGVDKPARSLVELTNDRNVFKTLHVSFVWILRACGSRISETLLEGPPTEDSIIDMEKQEETEEGFIKLFSKKISTGDDSDKGTTSAQTDASNQEETFRPEEPEEPAIRNIRLLLKILGKRKFHVMAHHVVIGNQIIVKGADKGVVKSVLNCLKSLLPRGCSRVILYSSSYEESWKCNFLGLSPDVAVPPHVISDERFLLVIISPKEKCDGLVVSELETFNYELQTNTDLPEKGPNVLSKMELALSNDSLNNDVVEQCLICMKEEWMNKVKVLFKFTKAGGSRSEEDRKKLIQVVGAQEEDKQLLQFWMTGLSVQYRTHILSTSKNQNSPT